MQITESVYHTPETNIALSIKYKVKFKKQKKLDITLGTKDVLLCHSFHFSHMFYYGKYL